MRIRQFAIIMAGLLLTAAAPSNHCSMFDSARTAQTAGQQQNLLARAEAEQDAAGRRLHAALAEVELELHGGRGTPAGPGPRYRAALGKAAAAKADLIRADEDIAVLRARERRDLDRESSR
jgi:hypothetical protein